MSEGTGTKAAQPTLIDEARVFIRAKMRVLAGWIDRTSNGRISPTAVTLFGLAMHVPIALLIASRHNWWAALLLVVFGLFDTLDGELARLQKRDSDAGMLLDASTDRIKEVLLYMGCAWTFASTNNPYMGMWAVAAVGASLLVSYIKAKGETVAAKSDLSAKEINHLFEDGFMRFEIRMVILIFGLITNFLAIALFFIAVLSFGTAIARLVRITRAINKPHAHEVHHKEPYEPKAPEELEPKEHDEPKHPVAHAPHPPQPTYGPARGVDGDRPRQRPNFSDNK